MLGHNSLAGFLKLRFLMNVDYSWSYEQFESIPPWEQEIHMILLQEYIQEKEAAKQRK